MLICTGKLTAKALATSSHLEFELQKKQISSYKEPKEENYTVLWETGAAGLVARTWLQWKLLIRDH